MNSPSVKTCLDKGHLNRVLYIKTYKRLNNNCNLATKLTVKNDGKI
jgi:hypothetical protein